LLGVIAAIRIMINDPERDRIWKKEADLIIEQKDKEIAQLRAQLAHYKRYRETVTEHAEKIISSEK